MTDSFVILMDVINSALKVLNSNGYFLRDSENEKFYIESVYYDPEDDELYCEFIEG